MKLSIVTPVFNSDGFIAETIESVINQKGEFSIEYIIKDGFSSDNTRSIIEYYQQRINSGLIKIHCHDVQIHLYSEKDAGMYDAINKGFEKATGDIYAWINADDIYLPGAFASIVKVFTSYDDVHWLKGITSYITEEATIWKAGSCLLYTQNWIKAGIYGREHYFIQQDSVFWRAWLWEKSGGIDVNFKLAGDYYLWIKFAEYVPLITVRAWLSCFRTVKGQLSADIKAYRQEAENFSPLKSSVSALIKLFFRFEKTLPSFVKATFFKVIFGQPDFSVILINSDGVTHRIKGAYYDVAHWL